jgi:hypothetical protein
MLVGTGASTAIVVAATVAGSGTWTRTVSKRIMGPDAYSSGWHYHQLGSG